MCVCVCHVCVCVCVCVCVFKVVASIRICMFSLFFVAIVIGQARSKSYPSIILFVFTNSDSRSSPAFIYVTIICHYYNLLEACCRYRAFIQL